MPVITGKIYLARLMQAQAFAVLAAVLKEPDKRDVTFISKFR
jgi:hypothetical protein